MGNMVSNSRLYADFGETEGGSGGGSIWLQFVQNIKDADDKSVEVKKAMGVRGGAGFVFKEGGGTLTISEYRQDDPQVSWRQLRKDQKIFVLAIQDDDGVRQRWFDCTVSKVDRDDDEDGNHMDSIEIKYLSSEESV